MFTSACFSSAQSSFIPKFLVDSCDKIRRVHTVLASSKMQEAQNVLKKKYILILVSVIDKNEELK